MGLRKKEPSPNEIAILMVLIEQPETARLMGNLRKRMHKVPDMVIYSILYRLRDLEYLHFHEVSSAAGRPQVGFQLNPAGVRYVAQILYDSSHSLRKEARKLLN